MSYDDMMKHRLIMLYGASPGAGITTLGTALVDALRQTNSSVTLVAEDDVLRLPEFAPMVSAFQNGDDDPAEACLQAARNFVKSRASDVTIADSIFPCFTWLFAADYSLEATAKFSDMLATLLAPLHPLIVYLDGDVPVLLQRAVAQRGAVWLDELTEDVRGYKRSQGQSVATFDDVVSFFAACKAFGQRLLADWLGEVITLSASDLSSDDAVRTVIARLYR